MLLSALLPLLVACSQGKNSGTGENADSPDFRRGNVTAPAADGATNTAPAAADSASANAAPPDNSASSDNATSSGIVPLSTATLDPLIGKPAPDFSLPLRNGQTLSLESLRGKVVVLNFWATWCPPCIEEIPALNRLHRQLKGLPVEVVGISVDDNWGEIEKLTMKRPVMFTLALDVPRGVPTRYGTSKFPETFILDKEGKVARKLIGAQLWDRGDFIAYLKNLAGS